MSDLPIDTIARLVMLVGLSPIMDLTKDSNMDITSKMRPALLTIFVTVFNINLSNAETINLPKFDPGDLQQLKMESVETGYVTDEFGIALQGNSVQINTTQGIDIKLKAIVGAGVSIHADKRILAPSLELSTASA